MQRYEEDSKVVCGCGEETLELVLGLTILQGAVDLIDLSAFIQSTVVQADSDCWHVGAHQCDLKQIIMAGDRY